MNLYHIRDVLRKKYVSVIDSVNHGFEKRTNGRVKIFYLYAVEKISKSTLLLESTLIKIETLLNSSIINRNLNQHLITKRKKYSTVGKYMK